MKVDALGQLDSSPLTLQSVGAESNVFSLFEQHAANTPDAIAVLGSHSSTTYRELALRAESVCRFLRERAIEPEEPIGVFLDRRAEMLAVLLGIWKAGGTYVPFDSDEPTHRVREMLASCGAKILLGDKSRIDKTFAHQIAAAVDCFHIDDVDATVDGPPSPCAPGGRRLAYLLFTSGSTGAPKAVEVEHRNVIALLRSASQLIGFKRSDRYLASSTIAFDASITELFLPVTTGATLVLQNRDVLLDPVKLAQLVRDLNVSIVQTGPSVWANILATVPDFPRVRVLITHGEAVESGLAEKLRGFGDEVWNLYGPTETTVWATGHRLSHETLESPSRISVPIGKPLPHIRAIVVDDACRQIDTGELGELCLGGESVARGYRNQADLTHERFVEINGERVYRTGDIVAQDEHGVLHYFGRNDEQMQIRGVRVEPREVESAILRHSDVTHAAATWFETPLGFKSVLAAVVLSRQSQCEAEELRRFLTTRLPSPMIPARFLFVQSLPVNRNGKIDRGALRAMLTTEGLSDALPERLRSDTESKLERVWERTIGKPPMLRDHFFSVGGDSLSAVRMVMDIEREFGLKLPEQLLYETPRFEDIAARIERLRSGEETSGASSGLVFSLVRRGKGSPLFFCNVDLGLGREGVWNATCPLYAVATWNSEGIVASDSMEDLASHCVSEIRAVQPVGPYRLAGFSFGGLIALEIAQQLTAAGEQVELLFLLDPSTPEKASTEVVSTESRRDPSTRGIVDLRWRSTYRGWVDWIQYLIVNQHLKSPSWITRLLLPKNRSPAFNHFTSMARKHYVARPYDGPAVLAYTHENNPEVWKSLLVPSTPAYVLEFLHLELFREPALGLWIPWIAEYFSPSGEESSGDIEVEADRDLPY